MKAAGVGAQGEPNHCGSNVTGLSLFPAKKSSLEATVYIIQHIQRFFLFQGNVVQGPRSFKSTHGKRVNGLRYLNSWIPLKLGRILKYCGYMWPELLVEW